MWTCKQKLSHWQKPKKKRKICMSHNGPNVHKCLSDFFKRVSWKCVLSRIVGKKLKGRNLLALWKWINFGLKIAIGANYTFISPYELSVVAPKISVTSSVNAWDRCEGHLLGSELEETCLSLLWHILLLSWGYFQEEMKWNILCKDKREHITRFFSDNRHRL